MCPSIPPWALMFFTTRLMSLLRPGVAYEPDWMLMKAMVIGAFDDAAMLGTATATLATPATATDAKTPRLRFFTVIPLVVLLTRTWAVSAGQSLTAPGEQVNSIYDSSVYRSRPGPERSTSIR